MLLSIPILVGTSFLIPNALACSRVNYHAGVDDRITIGRSMDFVTSTNSSIYIFPTGQKRNGSVGANSLQWTSKYGSMITSMYDIVSIDGMNTEGLTGSVLYLGSSDYGDRNASRPGLAIGWWLQYFLDSYPTVAAAVKGVQDQDIQVITKEMVPGVSSTGHIMLSDKSGDNLVMEYLDNKLVVHHGKQYQVMTNDPTYDTQLAVNEYWEPIANQSLPGTSTPAGKFASLRRMALQARPFALLTNNPSKDRYVRLSYYNRLSPESNDLESSVATTAAMIRAVSVPFVPEDQINSGVDVWPTLWRVYQDTKDMVFFYESAVQPMFFWMNFTDYDFSSKGQTKRLGLLNASWESRYGDMKGNFEGSKPFVPLGAS